MKDNLNLYLQVKKTFRDEILSELEERDIAAEWNYFQNEAEGTYSYYRMILDCECYDGGFIDDSVHDFLLEVLDENYYLFDEEFFEKLVNHRNDKKYKERLDNSYAIIQAAGKVVREAFH